MSAVRKITLEGTPWAYASEEARKYAVDCPRLDGEPALAYVARLDEYGARRERVNPINAWQPAKPVKPAKPKPEPKPGANRASVADYIKNRKGLILVPEISAATGLSKMQVQSALSGMGYHSKGRNLGWIKS